MDKKAYTCRIHLHVYPAFVSYISFDHFQLLLNYKSSLKMSTSLLKKFYFHLFSFVYKDCGGNELPLLPETAFHVMVNQSNLYGYIQSMQLKRGHAFDISRLKLVVHPIRCYSGRLYHLSRCIRKQKRMLRRKQRPYQLRSNRESDQCLCFHYTDYNPFST